MISCISRKVKEGKIIKVEVEQNEVIEKLRISGDFFIHPEDVLDDIEKNLTGLKSDIDYDRLVSGIQYIVREHDAQMIGISPESLALVIMEALK